MEKIDLSKINKVDPLKRIAEKETCKEEFSPMDPPDAFHPPASEDIPYEQRHAFIRKLMDEHRKCEEMLDEFEKTLIKIREQGIEKEDNKKLAAFFDFFDNNIITHNLKEEKILFPLLKQRFIENGEHSKGIAKHTSIDLLEDNHVKLLQLAAVTFNFMGLSGRLPDLNSRAIVMDTAIEQGMTLIEQIRLHIMREDKIVLAKAQKYLSNDEMSIMEEKANLFVRYN